MQTILIVEDDIDILLVTRVALKIAGYRPLEATSAEEALEIVAREDVDAILLDIRLPGMSGWEFLDHLRDTGRLASWPVIVTSAHEASDLAARGSQYGCAGYLAKPYGPDALARALATALPAA